MRDVLGGREREQSSRAAVVYGLETCCIVMRGRRHFFCDPYFILQLLCDRVECNS